MFIEKRETGYRQYIENKKAEISNVSSITKNKSFGQAFCGESPPPVLSILFYPIGWVVTECYY